MSRKPILCLDFDGVLHAYTSGWKGAEVVPDGPVPGAIAFLAAAVQRFDVHVFSSRSDTQAGRLAMSRALRDWCAAELGPDEGTTLWRALVLAETKPPALVTLDDRALTFDGTWPSLDDLAAFQPWTKRGKPAESSGIDTMFAERRRVHVYRLPDRLTEGYCFGGGHPIAFQNVDWFDVPVGGDRGELVGFIKGKRYYRPGARFLVLGDVPELTFVIEPLPAEAPR